MNQLSAAILTEHALRRLRRRGIPEESVRGLLNSAVAPQMVRPGRVVVQQILKVGSTRRPLLLRVFVDVDRSPPEVVTVYVTSKVAKYTRSP